MIMLLSLFLSSFLCGRGGVEIRTVISHDEKSYEVKLYNESPDTVYLFDTYINPEFFDSDYIHQYECSSQTHIVSFLPLLSYVGFFPTDVFRLKEEKLVTRGQLQYHFTTIAPCESVLLSFPSSIVSHSRLIRSINQKRSSIWRNRMTFRVCKKPRVHHYDFAFAIYRDVSLLLSPDAFSDAFVDINKASQLDNAAHNYSIVRVRLNTD